MDNIRFPSRGPSRFAAVPDINIPRSQFDLSRRYKTTFDGGYLVPFYRQFVYPGDTHNVRANIFGRLATPLKPFMDNLDATVFYFYVPLRLLWTNFEKFCGAQTNPGDSISYTTPKVTLAASGGAPVGSIMNYLGVPGGSQITGPTTIVAWYTRAYNFIWNTHFRDENLQNSVTFDTGDGPDTIANYVLKRRGKRHDYFTACLPFAQKGTAVTIPAGASSAPVTLVPYTTNSNAMLARIATTDVLKATNNNIATVAANGRLDDAATLAELVIDPNGRLTADLSSAFATTINALRLAEQTQVLLERDARGGTRLQELIASQFGVMAPDFRLQRPEYLGGSKTPVTLHPVPNTTKGDGTVAGAQGNLAAFGTFLVEGAGFAKSFVEHGVIIGLIHVGAELSYQQGVERDLFDDTRYDMYWPAFAHIGEQAVLNREIYHQGTNVAADTEVFGYIGRYDHHRYGVSLITGKLASTYATPLDTFHLAQKFTSKPTLGDTFISDTPPIDRVIAVTTEPHFIMDAAIKAIAARPMPMYAVPALAGRF